MLNELAIDAEGEPFEVPAEVVRWRVRRVEGRGKPGLVYLPGQGKPLLLELQATHADLARKAGPGRYRLDPVDAAGRRIDGAPVAVTGPLEAIDDATSEASGSYEETSTMTMPSASVRRPSRVEDMLVVAVEANTRVVEKAIGQLGGLMTGMAELLTSAHGAGLTNRVPVFLPALPPKERVEIEEVTPSSGMPEWLTVLIQQAVQAIVPMMVTKIPSMSGMPLGALMDWSKAVPTTAAPSPGAPSPAHVTHAPGPRVPAPEPPPSPPVWPSAVEVAGNAPIGATRATAVPASSRAATDDSVPLATHITQVWQALSLPEQGRAYQLIELLTPDERTAWIAELAGLTLSEAVARIRGVIQHQTPAAADQLPSSPPGNGTSS